MQVAEAVAAEIKAMDLGEPCHAIAAWRPFAKVEELSVLRASVVPRNTTYGPRDRGRQQCDVTVEVGIQKRLEGLDPADADPIAVIADKVNLYLGRPRLTQMPEAMYEGGMESESSFDVSAYDNFRVFTAVMRFTYRVLREVP